MEVLDDGEIWVGEREISALSPRDRQIGMMFQGYALYPHLTVRNNLAYPLRVRHVPGEEANGRVVEVARLLGIEKLLDRNIQQISGGEQQRVAIGRAIVQKPNLYLLDEPISNLDASLRETVRTEVRRLQRQLGATMIMVTHDQMDALAVADRIAVLGEGALQQSGTPEELYQKPANLFVAGFMGNLRMNLLSCQYPGRNAAALEGRGFQFPLPAETAKALPAEARPVVLGFRPEELEVHRSAQEGALPLRSRRCISRATALSASSASAPRRFSCRRRRGPVGAKRGGLGERAAESDPHFRPGERREARSSRR